MPTAVDHNRRFPDDASGYLPVHIESMIDQAVDIDLFIRIGRATTPALYQIGDGYVFSRDRCARLVEQGVRVLYVAVKDHGRYREIVNRRLESTFTDPNLAREERRRLVRDACSHMIDDVMLFPGSTETVRSVIDVSEQFTRWSQEAEFSYLLDMSAHDYYTSMHMVNVGVGCGLLAQKARPDDEEFFQQCVLGGLLHDVGKRHIPAEVLNKEGRLSEEEWALIEQHPDDGFADLSAVRDLPEAALSMTRDHHEKLDGSGYPRGLAKDQISLVARICAIVDVFDSLSSARPYRDVIPPQRVLLMMEEERGRHFDPELLDHWGELVRGLIKEDPSRAPLSDGGRAVARLTDLIPTKASNESPTELRRRSFERFSCEVVGALTLLDGSANSTEPAGATADFKAFNVSRSGVGGLCERRFSPGDRVEVSLQSPSGDQISRHALVSRASGEVEPGQWFIGLRFCRSEPTGRRDAA